MKPITTYKAGPTWRVDNGELIFDGKGRPARSQTGYGGKIKTDYKTESPFRNKQGITINKLYRVYSCQYSNCATLYVIINNKVHVLNKTF